MKAEKNNKEEKDGGETAGIIIAVIILLAIAIVLAVIGFIIYRKRNQGSRGYLLGAGGGGNVKWQELKSTQQTPEKNLRQQVFDRNFENLQSGKTDPIRAIQIAQRGRQERAAKQKARGGT